MRKNITLTLHVWAIVWENENPWRFINLTFYFLYPKYFFFGFMLNLMCFVYYSESYDPVIYWDHRISKKLAFYLILNSIVKIPTNRSLCYTYITVKLIGTAKVQNTHFMRSQLALNSFFLLITFFMVIVRTHSHLLTKDRKRLQ